MNEEITEKIKSRGHSITRIKPLSYEKKRFRLSECKQIIRDNKVNKRGWDFPHYSLNDPPDSIENRIECAIDWEDIVELWRFYQSGQFIHLWGLMEDWQETGSPNNQFLAYPSVLYRVTEIFEFASRLTESTILDSEVEIGLKLVGMQGRKIGTFSSRRRTSFRKRFVCKSNHIEISNTYSREKLLESSSTIAIDQTIEILERFQWSPPKELLYQDQEDFFNQEFS